jgi:hypothetical protein
MILSWQAANKGAGFEIRAVEEMLNEQLRIANK